MNRRRTDVHEELRPLREVGRALHRLLAAQAVELEGQVLPLRQPEERKGCAERRALGAARERLVPEDGEVLGVDHGLVHRLDLTRDDDVQKVAAAAARADARVQLGVASRRLDGVAKLRDRRDQRVAKNKGAPDEEGRRTA